MRLDHLLSKEHSHTCRALGPVGVSELSPAADPYVVRSVAHWVEHYREDSLFEPGGHGHRVDRGAGGDGFGKTHCWVSETALVVVSTAPIH